MTLHKGRSSFEGRCQTMESIALPTSLCQEQGVISNNWAELREKFEKMCRVCGAHNDYLIPIFDTEQELSDLNHKIHMYLPLQVRREDVLPSQLCYECMSSILSWHTLYQKCQEANQKFQTMLEQSELPVRQNSVLILPAKNSDQSPVSYHSFSDQRNHQIDVTNHEDYPDNLLANQSVAHQQTSQLTYEMKFNTSVQHLNGKEVEVAGQNILDGTIESGEQIENGVITNTSYILSNMPNEVNEVQCCAPLSSTYPRTQSIIENKSYSQFEYSTSNTDVTVKKSTKENSLMKKKTSPSTSGSISQTFQSLKSDVPGQLPNRVSAIQLTTNHDFPQNEGASRSKSVLVRHESKYPSVLVSGSKNNITGPEQGTFIESAVIREHRNIGNVDNDGKGTMVSVVRPTCLRRAPTAVVVIENISSDCDLRLNDKKDQIFDGLNPKNIIGQGLTDAKEDCTKTDTLQRSSSGEANGSDQSHICFFCKKFISNPKLLLSHEKSHLTDSNPPLTFICKFCLHPQNSLHEMHLHYSSHETEIGKQQRSESSKRIYLCNECGLVCATEERLAGHQRLHTDNFESFRHKCKTCGENFTTRSKLSIHLWTHALKPSFKTFKCHICGKGFGTKSSLMEHRLKHTDEEKSRAFKCVICSMAFGNNTLLGKHRFTHTQEELARPFKCTVCGKAFARNHTLQIHHLSHSNQKCHQCNQCEKRFKLKNSLMQHLRTHQDPSVLPSYQCGSCGKTFRVRSRLRDHLRLHSGEKPFACETCGKCFHKVTALHTHEISHTERRAFRCDFCGKAFKWSKNLRKHKLIHIHATTSKAQPKTSVPSSGDFAVKSKPIQKLYQCELCGKEFSSKGSLQHHTKRIHNASPHKSVLATICSICSKEFSTAAGLLRHTKIIHGGIKAFKCDICNREYSTKVAKDDHRRSHTGERPYSCSVCPKAFSSLSNLHIHKASHSEDRPHKCPYCDKQFKRRAHLVPHIRTHTGEKPYICNVCSRGFAQSNDLHKHRLTHSSDRAFTCCCGQAYRTKRDLDRHQSKHHHHNLPEAQAEVLSESSKPKTGGDISHLQQRIIVTPGFTSTASNFNSNQTSTNSVISSTLVSYSLDKINKR